MTANKGTDDHADDDSRTSENGQSGDTPAAPKPPAAEAGPQGDDNKKKSVPAAGEATTVSAAQDKKQSENTRPAVGGNEPKPGDVKTAERGRQPKAASDTAQSGQQASAAGASTGAAADQRATARGAGDTHGPDGGSGGGDSNGKRSKLPVIVAIIALVVAIIALVVAVWLWRQGKQNTSSLATRIENVQSNLQASVQDMVAEPLEQMSTRIEQAMTTVDAAQQAGQQRAQAVAELRSQLRQTRMQLAGVMQQLQGDARRWWQLEQIEHLLTVANRRLQLYGEPEQASAALEVASRMISRINDPRLFKLRKSIVNNIAALDALPSPDIAGMALKLSAFIEQVPDLPLASDVPANYQSHAKADAAAKTSDKPSDQPGIDWTAGWQRFVDSVGNAVQSMATIRRADGTQPALLPPDKVYFLTQNLMLELRAARLALLEGNSTLYHQSLATATAWLKQYFDTSDSGVQAMLEGLQELQNVKLDWQAPDISSSLRTLHGYMQEISQPDGDATAGADEAQSTARQQDGEQ